MKIKTWLGVLIFWRGKQPKPSLNEKFIEWMIARIEEASLVIRTEVLRMVKYHPILSGNILSGNLLRWRTQFLEDARIEDVAIFNDPHDARELVKAIKARFSKEISAIDMVVPAT